MGPWHSPFNSCHSGHCNESLPLFLQGRHFGTLPGTRGIMQGGPASMELFEYALDAVLSGASDMWIARGWCFNVLHRQVCALAGCDDLYLLAAGMGQLTQMVQELEGILAKYGASVAGRTLGQMCCFKRSGTGESATSSSSALLSAACGQWLRCFTIPKMRHLPAQGQRGRVLSQCVPPWTWRDTHAGRGRRRRLRFF